MRDCNDKQQDLDDCFKDHFGDFEAPKMNLEEDQETRINEDSFDQLFQSQLQDIEKQPADKIWENVQKELPLHLIWRRRLNQLSRVAAVLLIGLFFTMLIAQKSSSLRNLVFKENTPPPAQAIPVDKKPNTDFVFDAHPKHGGIDQQEDSKTVFGEEMASANGDKDGEGNLKMNPEPLSPLPSLPIKEINLAANEITSERESEAAMTISIPLRVANDKEVDGLIDQSEVDIMARHNMVNPAQ